MSQPMQWKKDLVSDIRTSPENDDIDRWEAAYQDHPYRHEFPWIEMSENNRNAIKERFLRVAGHAKAVLEIGVAQHRLDQSSYAVFLQNKKHDTVYIGLDIQDKSELEQPANNVFTICEDSSNIDTVMEKVNALGVTEFDFIFIDGEHSLSQVYRDWEYTRFLAPGGIVGFHDVSTHPGPTEFIKAIDKNKWHVEENVCPRDWGVGFAWKK